MIADIQADLNLGFDISLINAGSFDVSLNRRKIGRQTLSTATITTFRARKYHLRHYLEDECAHLIYGADLGLTEVPKTVILAVESRSVGVLDHIAGRRVPRPAEDVAHDQGVALNRRLGCPGGKGMRPRGGRNYEAVPSAPW